MDDQQQQQKLNMKDKVIASLRNQIANKTVYVAECEALIETIGQENRELQEKQKEFDENKEELEKLRKQFKKSMKGSNSNKKEDKE